MSLIAREIEANGIPTIIMGSAMDIILHCGVPRYVHSDLPLGNPCGAPFDKAMQKQVMACAYELLNKATKPNSIVRSPASWPGDDSWRDEYSKVDDTNRELLRLKGQHRRQQQAEDKAQGKQRAAMISDS